MTTSLQTAVRVNITANHQSTGEEMSTPKDTVAKDFAKTLINGVAIDTADLIFHDEVTLTTGNTDKYDLRATLLDKFGNVLTFEVINLLYVENTESAAAAILEVGGATSFDMLAPWLSAGDGIKVSPGGVFLIFDPSLVGMDVGEEDTNDEFVVGNNSGVSITYRIIIVGRSE